jgi:hypothetical protein
MVTNGSLSRRHSRLQPHSLGTGAASFKRVLGGCRWTSKDMKLGGPDAGRQRQDVSLYLNQDPLPRKSALLRDGPIAPMFDVDSYGSSRICGLDPHDEWLDGKGVVVGHRNNATCLSE